MHTFHKSKLNIRQAGNSRYAGIAVNLGASWARTDYKVRLEDEQASCRLNGLYLTTDQQLSDFHLDIDHAVPGCHSDEHFKGILLGTSRAVFDGRVRVAPDAQKTEAHLKNDNLLLSRNAEIDTKPLLEIFADDVQCSHGTTVGQLDDEQLFYLRSRGIDEQRARSMLCHGFAREVLADCSVPGFLDYVSNLIQTRI
jgi:Fe-S cluster assembly protein SufD